MLRLLKKLLFLFIFIIASISGTPGPLFPGELSSQNDYVPFYELRSGIDLIIKGEYEKLLEYSGSLQENGKNLTGRFLKASMYYARMGEIESLEGSADFHAEVDHIISETKSRIDRDPNDIESRFYLGSVLCFRAVIRQKEGSIIRAWRDGVNGKKELEKCLKLAPEFLEPHLAIGSYRYWSSAKNPLRFLRLVKDARKQGILEIEENIKPGSFSYALSLNQLIWISLDYNDYDNAESIAQEGLKLYPSSRFFLYPAAITAQKRGKWHDAALLLQKVKESLESDELVDTYFWLKVTVKQAESLVETGEIEKAIALCSAVLQSSIIPSDLEKSRDFIDRAKKIERLSTNRVKN